jgi:hypothetical protein
MAHKPRRTRSALDALPAFNYGFSLPLGEIAYPFRSKQFFSAADQAEVSVR